jgi:hypothetical protein
VDDIYRQLQYLADIVAETAKRNRDDPDRRHRAALFPRGRAQRSLSKASGNLHVAVSALSRQIAKLEEVGAALFERRPRGMVAQRRGAAACRVRGATCSTPSA